MKTIFSVNLTENNEIEEINFKKSNNYAISRPLINQLKRIKTIKNLFLYQTQMQDISWVNL